MTVKGFIIFEFIEGEFTYTGNTISGSDSILASAQRAVILAENHADKGITYTLTDSALIVDAEHIESIFSITAGDVTNLEQYGRVINNFTERGFTLTEGSSSVLKLGNYILPPILLRRLNKYRLR